MGRKRPTRDDKDTSEEGRPAKRARGERRDSGQTDTPRDASTGAEADSSEEQRAAERSARLARGSVMRAINRFGNGEEKALSTIKREAGRVRTMAGTARTPSANREAEMATTAEKTLRAALSRGETPAAAAQAARDAIAKLESAHLEADPALAQATGAAPEPAPAPAPDGTMAPDISADDLAAAFPAPASPHPEAAHPTQISETLPIAPVGGHEGSGAPELALQAGSAATNHDVQAASVGAPHEAAAVESLVEAHTVEGAAQPQQGQIASLTSPAEAQPASEVASEAVPGAALAHPPAPVAEAATIVPNEPPAGNIHPPVAPLAPTVEPEGVPALLEEHVPSSLTTTLLTGVTNFFSSML